MEDKTFTQEEVNTIVQDRLAKEKAKYEKQLADVQADVSRREKRLQAREELSKRGLPDELVDLVKLDNDDELNTSLELLEKTYKQSSQGHEKAGAAASHYVPVSGEAHRDDPIREAMGLRRR